MIISSNKGSRDAHLLKEAKKIVHRGHVGSKLQLADFLWTSKGKDKAAALLHSRPSLAFPIVDLLAQPLRGPRDTETLLIPHHHTSPLYAEPFRLQGD